MKERSFLFSDVLFTAKIKHMPFTVIPVRQAQDMHEADESAEPDGMTYNMRIESKLLTLFVYFTYS